jgi:hypothetical protein
MVECMMAGQKQSIRAQLAEVDALIEQAERRATVLRDHWRTTVLTTSIQSPNSPTP